MEVQAPQFRFCHKRIINDVNRSTIKKSQILRLDSIRTAFQFFLYIVCTYDLLYYALNIQPIGVVGGMRLITFGMYLAFDIELFIV